MSAAARDAVPCSFARAPPLPGQPQTAAMRGASRISNQHDITRRAVLQCGLECRKGEVGHPRGALYRACVAEQCLCRAVCIDHVPSEASPGQGPACGVLEGGP